MANERDDTAARALHAELRQLADTILDLEARGRLLTDLPRLLKMLGDARSRVFAYEVRGAPAPRTETTPTSPASAEPPESRRIIDEAIEREREAREEWQRRWQQGRAEGES